MIDLVAEDASKYDEVGFGFLVKDSPDKIGIVGVSKILRANMGIGDYLENFFAVFKQDVAGFVVERNDGFVDPMSDVGEGFADGAS